MENFINYVTSFYGPGGIYDLGVTKMEIANACRQYVRKIDDNQWGGGDSIDRERVRQILQPEYSPCL